MDDLLVQKWEETGLLEGLVGEDKVVTAKGFEVLFEYLMDDFFPKQDLKILFSSTIIPIYRRFVSSKFFPNPSKLYSHYKAWLKEMFKRKIEWDSKEDPELFLVTTYVAHVKLNLQEIL